MGARRRFNQERVCQEKRKQETCAPLQGHKTVIVGGRSRRDPGHLEAQLEVGRLDGRGLVLLLAPLVGHLKKKNSQRPFTKHQRGNTHVNHCTGVK